MQVSNGLDVLAEVKEEHMLWCGHTESGEAKVILQTYYVEDDLEDEFILFSRFQMKRSIVSSS
jgi:hypothetical protein